VAANLKEQDIETKVRLSEEQYNYTFAIFGSGQYLVSERVTNPIYCPANQICVALDRPNPPAQVAKVAELVRECMCRLITTVGQLRVLSSAKVLPEYNSSECSSLHFSTLTLRSLIEKRVSTARIRFLLGAFLPSHPDHDPDNFP
jgi:hypothetical protein